MPSQLELELLLLTGSESSYLLFIKNVNFHKLSRKCEHYRLDVLKANDLMSILQQINNDRIENKC